METRNRPLKFCKSEIEANKAKMLERFMLYKKMGYDREASRDLILTKAGPIEGKVLEIGTGKGHLAVKLAEKTGRLTTVDISKDEQRFAMLNAAASGVLNKITFKECDAAALPYPNSSFETVISVNAFHHFEHPFAVLKEMIRVCAKKLVIADLNDAGFEIIRNIHKSEGREHEEHHGDFGIVGVYLKEHGFCVEKSDGYFQTIYVANKTEKRCVLRNPIRNSKKDLEKNTN